jgi:group II intron reverse transcriptase/maturase
MSTNLRGIGEKARSQPELVFTSLYHHITDTDNLRACYDALPKDRAVGIDGVSKEKYGEKLEENLLELSARLRRMGYRPQPKRRTYIPKPGTEKGRPLAISCLEDKIVERAVKQVLELIYESDFEESSYGYRPGRSQHACLNDLGKTIQQKRVRYVVEADICSFFDEVKHEWLLKFLRHRIGDPRVIRLIQRMLRGGVLEDGLVQATERGTPQGSILSPLLSNVYLHYALDVWFERRLRRQVCGEAYYFRFADDFVACFQSETAAKEFVPQLNERLGKFGLKLAAHKTRCIRFGRYAREDANKRGRKPDEFTFLGFTHYCGKTKNGYFKVKRRTNRKRLGQSLRAFTDWARSAYWKLRKGEMIRSAKRRVQGHLNYYAITDNSRQCDRYVHWVERILFRWLNRKSQRRAYTWAGYRQALAWNRWPSPRVRKHLNPCRTTELPQ